MEAKPTAKKAVKKAAAPKKSATKVRKEECTKGRRKTGKRIKHKAPPMPETPRDPWEGARSPYGGRASPEEELSRLRREREQCAARAPKEAAAEDGGLFVELHGGAAESSTAWGQVVWLDCPSGSVTASELAAARWLRGLRLRGDSSSQLPGFGGVWPKLLELDLSGNANGIGKEVLDGLAPGAPNLRALSLQQCGLESASLSVIGGLCWLEELDVSMNKLGELASLIKALEPRKRQWTRLRVDGNPIAQLEREQLIAWCRQSCPCLVDLNGEGPLTTALAAASALTLEQQEHGGAVGAENLQDRASCSCVEGNPCAVKYNCKNWAKRLEVAKEKRAELAYQIG